MVYVGGILKKCVVGVCEALVCEEEKLNELDRGSGDGDCGTTLKAGALGTQHLHTVKCVKVLSF